MLQTVISWPTFAVVLLVFGLAPGALLRVIVLAYPRDDPRRRERVAELYVVPRILRPLFVAEQLELAISEGLFPRLISAWTRGRSDRWHLESGVELNREHPATFWIPSQTQKAGIRLGLVVQLAFSTEDGWGERMWVEVDAISDDVMVGRLLNEPVGIGGLYRGQCVGFTSEHVIDIDDPEDAAGRCIDNTDPRGERTMMLCRGCTPKRPPER